MGRVNMLHLRRRVNVPLHHTAGYNPLSKGELEKRNDVSVHL
jgi:hypothetical protein